MIYSMCVCVVYQVPGLFSIVLIIILYVYPSNSSSTLSDDSSPLERYSAASLPATTIVTVMRETERKTYRRQGD